MAGSNNEPGKEQIAKLAKAARDGDEEAVNAAVDDIRAAETGS